MPESEETMIQTPLQDLPLTRWSRRLQRRLLASEHKAYFDARYRCENPNNNVFKYYGGRGIKFLFTSFDQFFAELGSKPTPQHSLDRIENDGNYEPGNVRWATKQQQSRNQRHGNQLPLESRV
jgi:hypothetical protein